MSGLLNTADTQRRQDLPAKSPRRFLGFDITLDWLTRPLFGFALAAIAIAATLYGGFWFALFVAAGGAAAAREWHRMFAGANYFRVCLASITGIAVSAGVEVLVPVNPQVAFVPWAILGAIAMLNLLLSAKRGLAALWHGASMIYVGIPVISLVAIRETSAHGMWELFALFIAVWLTDTGALISGSLLKGPKLWPSVSPNKTWAGAIGGGIAGTVATAILFLFLRANPWVGALLGFFVSIVGQFGDLFESFLKRKVGRKNSGSLIPGHGGVLDRIDSMLFVAPVAAFVFLIAQMDPFMLGVP